MAKTALITTPKSSIAEAVAAVANVYTPELPTPAFELLPLVQLHPSPLNPRKTFDPTAHAELVESVRAKGVIVPIMVRPEPPIGGTAPQYELVYGERRYRAAKEAGLTHLPALVRALEDREVLELAITENVERNDMTPLEEGGAYKKLHAMGRSVEEIAALVGRTRATIYGRMKLAELEGEARKAVEAGDLHSTAGVLVARLPTHEMQDDAFALLKEKTHWQKGIKGLTYEDAVEILRAQFSLKLKDAPFDTKDPYLVAGCGACTDCPKRTGAQPELFKDVKSDTCLDRPCYQGKVKAHAKVAKVAITAKAEKQGLEVLPASALKSKDYVDLEKVVYDYDAGGEKKVKTLLGRHAPEPSAVVIDGTGRAHNLVKAEDARKALEKAGKKNMVDRVAPRPQSSDGGARDWAAEQKKQQEAQDLRRKVSAEALVRIIDLVELSKETPATFLRLVISLLGADRTTLERHQVKNREELERAANSMPEPKLRGLVVDLLLSDSCGNVWSGYAADFKDWCERFGVDLKKIEAEHKQKAKDAEKAAAAAEKKPAPAKAKKGAAA